MRAERAEWDRRDLERLLRSVSFPLTNEGARSGPGACYTRLLIVLP